MAIKKTFYSISIIFLLMFRSTGQQVNLYLHSQTSDGANTIYKKIQRRPKYLGFSLKRLVSYSLKMKMFCFSNRVHVSSCHFRLFFIFRSFYRCICMYVISLNSSIILTHKQPNTSMPLEVEN